MSERLIKLLDEADLFLRNRASSSPAPLNEYDISIMLDIAKVCDEAARMLEKVIVPPCKVGDVVYVIFSQFRNEISKCRVDEFSIQENEMCVVVDIHYPNFIAKRGASIPFWWFGRFAFLTREEAEQALKGGTEW